jgi:hypothetical protein
MGHSRFEKRYEVSIHSLTYQPLEVRMKFLGAILCLVSLSFAQMTYFDDGKTGGFFSTQMNFPKNTTGLIFSGGFVATGRVCLQGAYIHSSSNDYDMSINGFGVGAIFAALKQNATMPISLPLSLQYQYGVFSAEGLDISVSERMFSLGIGLDRKFDMESMSVVPNTEFSYYSSVVYIGDEDVSGDGELLDLGISFQFLNNNPISFGIEPSILIGFQDEDPVFSITGTVAFCN